jgi:AraC-like DNA-binding protein
MSEAPFRHDQGKYILPGGYGPAPEGFFSLTLVKSGILRISSRNSIISVRAGSAVFQTYSPSAKAEPSNAVQAARVDFARSALDIEYLAEGAAWVFGFLYPAPRPHARSAPGTDSREDSAERTPIVIGLPEKDFIEAWSIMARLRSGIVDGSGRGMERLRLAELAMIVFRGRNPACPAAGRAPQVAAFDIGAVISYLRERSSEDLRLADIAKRFGVHPAYLSRVFSEREGVPLFEYLNRTRISKACALLKRSSMSVLEIAYAVGYNNLSHFNRVFKRIAGASPREFRRVR